MKIKFYSDPGHGWGAVKRKVLDELGIADQITHFSYQKGQTVYLEEDSDLPALVTKLALNGVTVEYEQHSTGRRSPIRSYDRFSAT
jgi:hypothetical protein